MHLLKEKSKPVPQAKKRRKLNPYGGEFTNAEEVKHEEIPGKSQSLRSTTPNIIGNVGDQNS